MHYLIGSYLIYGVTAVALTAWLGLTLARSGEVFLASVFEEDRMAHAVNQLLVVGFYMLNLGFAFLIFQADASASRVEASEQLVTRLGLLLFSLGVLHFLNMAVFWKLRQRKDEPAAPLPAPTTYVPLPPPTSDVAAF